MALHAPARQPGLTATVVICAHADERWEETLDAVTSVQRQVEPPDEILVVVDHNPSLAARLAARFPGVVVVENEGEQGVAGARNTGVATARSELIVFLDDDTVAGPGWLRAHKEIYAGDDAVIAAGGAATPHWRTGRPRWFPEEFGWVVACRYTGLPAGRQAVRNLFTCNMSVRRRPGQVLPSFVGSRVGSMVRCEDTQFCIELGRAVPGGRIEYDPELAVRAMVGPERATFAYFIRRCWDEGRAKAALADSVGTAALDSERSYVTTTLVPAVLRYLGRAVRRGRFGELQKAGAVLTGFAATAAGYVSARVVRRVWRI